MSLHLAKKIAHANDLHDKWMLGAVLVKSGSVISVGLNKTKNNPAYIQFEHCSVHAEIDALRKVKSAKGCVMYVARRLKGGGWGMALPCNRCKKQLRAAGIKRAIYTIDDENYGVWEP